MRAGYLYGLAAYFMWGLFPLYFDLLERSGAVEIVAYRALFSFVFCLILIPVARRWRTLLAALRRPKLAGTLAVAGFIVALNWTLYVYAVVNGHTLDAAMGYFINPLISAALGLVVLREKLSRAQQVAFGFGIAAVVALVVGYGHFPWLAVAIAFTFALYALVKKQAGNHVGPLEGFTIETTAMLPVAVGYLLWLSERGTVDFTTPYAALVALSGPITAVPLLLFAAAAPRVSMAAIGMMQYVTPTMQFLIGALILREPLPPERLVGFVLVWIAVAIFTADAVARGRRMSRIARAIDG